MGRGDRGRYTRPSPSPPGLGRLSIIILRSIAMRLASVAWVLAQTICDAQPPALTDSSDHRVLATVAASFDGEMRNLKWIAGETARHWAEKYCRRYIHNRSRQVRQCIGKKHYS